MGFVLCGVFTTILFNCAEATGKVNFNLNKLSSFFNHKNKKFFSTPAPLPCQFVGRQFLLLPPIRLRNVASSLWPGALLGHVRPQ